MGANGALGEHICLAFEISLLIQHLQRTQQEIAGILAKGKAVASTGKKTVLFRIVIVQRVEPCLLLLNVLIGVAFGLVVNKPAHTIPESNHAADAVLRRNGKLHGIHATVFPEVHLPVHDSVAEIPHIGISGDGIIFFLQFLMLVLGDLCMKILDGSLQKLR